MIEVELWQAVGAVLVPVVAGAVGLLTYLRIPKRDVGSAALAAVEAAAKASDMLEESYEQKVDDLADRVKRLEEILVEREDEISKLEQERLLLLQWIAALTEQMEQLAKKTGQPVIPITFQEIEDLDRWSNQK